MRMKEPGISLCQYLQKQQIDDEKREAHGLSLICRKCEVGKALPGTAMIPLLIQKMRNEIFIQEIIRIQEAFEKGGEKVIFIKGVPLAEDIYEPPYVRRSGDIDIIVEYDRAPEALEILDSLGYFQAYNRGIEKEESINGEYYKKYIDEFGQLRMHFPVFQKCTTNKDGKEKRYAWTAIYVYFLIYPIAGRTWTDALRTRYLNCFMDMIFIFWRYTIGYCI